MFNFIKKLLSPQKPVATRDEYLYSDELYEKERREFQRMIQRDREVYGVSHSIGAEALKELDQCSALLPKRT